MRLLKIALIALLAAVALTAGAVVVAVVAVVGMAVFLAARLLRGATASRQPRVVQPRSSAKQSSDVIEITATEVPIDPSPR